MWDWKRQLLGVGRSECVVVRQHGRPVPYSSVLRSWQDDAEFRSAFMQMLVDAPFKAFRWETPPIDVATANRDFEFVLIDAPGVDREVEPQAFAEHFNLGTAIGTVVSFLNLGKDAVLIVPKPTEAMGAYGHLAAFSRRAPVEQQHELWRTVGAAVENRLSNRPVWLSTAGMGVSWLHIRLDSRPKYYGHRPYADES